MKIIDIVVLRIEPQIGITDLHSQALGSWESELVHEITLAIIPFGHRNISKRRTSFAWHVLTYYEDIRSLISAHHAHDLVNVSKIYNRLSPPLQNHPLFAGWMLFSMYESNTAAERQLRRRTDSYLQAYAEHPFAQELKVRLGILDNHEKNIGNQKILSMWSSPESLDLLPER